MRKTGLPKAQIIGAAYLLWDYGDNHADEEGRLYWNTLDEIAAIVGSKEIAEAFCDKEVGWLQVHADYILLPEWGKYNSQSAKQRMRHNRNVAKSRCVKKTQGQPANANAQGARATRPQKPTEFL